MNLRAIDEPHDGAPLDLSIQDLPLSVPQLVELAHYYHPQMADRTFATADELDRFIRATPQRRARVAAHDRAMAHRRPWREFVEAIAEQAPGHHVEDATRPYRLEQAYVAVIGVAEGGAPSSGYPTHRLVVMASIVAPIYYMYESFDDPHRIEHELSGSWAQLVAVIEREMAARFAYQRLSYKAGGIRLPKLRIGTLPDGESTVVDALFTDYRW